MSMMRPVFWVLADELLLPGPSLLDELMPAPVPKPHPRQLSEEMATTWSASGRSTAEGSRDLFNHNDILINRGRCVLSITMLQLSSLHVDGALA